MENTDKRLARFTVQHQDLGANGRRTAAKRPASPSWGVVPLVLLGLGQACPGASLSYSTSQPVPGSSDVTNFTGANADRDNIGGNGTTDGGANDATTYVAPDRPHQGQTFQTGAAAAGYHVQAVWLKHAAYSGQTQSTYWRTATGTSLTVRITNPAAAATAGFALASETATLSGTESGTPNNLAPKASLTSSPTGTGVWVRIALDEPVNLQPNTLYGFDVTSNSATLFFETHGIRNAAAGGNPYAAGSAYNGSTNGSPDNKLNALSGDRVFMVELAEGTVTPVDTTPYAQPVLAAEAFPLDRVRLLDSRFKHNQDLNRTGYLTWIEPGRLLAPFRSNAGLSTQGFNTLGGWEGGAGGSGFTACRGHMAGHWMSAVAKMHASTGDPGFIPKIQQVVDGLKACQDELATKTDAAGRPLTGYLAAFPISFFETLETNHTAAQVPFYTVHKILTGLTDVYRYLKVDSPALANKALDMAIAMSDYHALRVSWLTTAQVENMFLTDNGNTEEWGGMNETLTDIYQLSKARGDANPERHLTLAKVFHRDWFINPLHSDLDQLGGLHANTHVPQVTGFTRVASMLNTADPQRDRLYTAADHFWHRVTRQHSFVLGGNSYAEHFSTAGKETGTNGGALTVSTAETCNTYNMLKLAAGLFQHNPAAEYADYYEHALYNHILASMAPDTGMFTYFVPMVSGHFKTYCQEEGSCWCCTGSGMENPSQYGAAIYFHKNDALWVNLYIPSTLDWSEKAMTVRLDTAFPLGDTARLTMGCAQPTTATIRLRIPSWIESPPTITVNGTPQGIATTPGSYAEISRTWADGDVIGLTLPMGLRLDRSMDDATQTSLFYGPVLLAGVLGTSGLPASDEAADQWAYQNVARASAPVMTAPDATDPASWVRPAGQPLEFTVEMAYPGSDERTPITLKPFYEVHHTRYAVYWKTIAPEGACNWTGGGALPTWSTSGNWDVAPASAYALNFAAAAGGTPVNDFTAGTRFDGIGFPSGAGAYVLGGNGVGLMGDVRNLSAVGQRINLPLDLTGGIPWRMDADAGDLTLGGAIGGTGSIEKRGDHTLLLLSDVAFNGALRISAGSVQIGTGGTTGSVAATIPISVSAGASLVLDRGDDFEVANRISGAGTLIKRGSGAMTLANAADVSGLVHVASGKLRFGSRQAQRLVHRWSFNGNLTDSAGGADATVVDVGPNNTTLGSNDITVAGGTRSAADYVSLGGGLLPKDGSPVTIEFWATQVSLKPWSRIFDIGASTTENLFMSWSQDAAGTDRVEWRDGVTDTVNNSVGPAIGTEYHIAMVIEPGAGSGGASRVTWYAAPSSAGTLGPAKGTLDTGNTLADFTDTNFWLGRSEYSADATANAKYNEFRIWNRSFTGGELDALHTLGPDEVGGFATETITGSLTGVTDLSLGAGAEFDAGSRTQRIASLSGAANSIIRLTGGQLHVASGGDGSAAFAGAFAGTGTVVNDGTLRLVGGTAWPADVALVNHGLLDIMTWQGDLPVGFTNDGTVLDRSRLKANGCEISGGDFKVRIHGYPGHSYRFQKTDDPGSGKWHDTGDPVAGADASIEFTDTIGAGASRGFYRVGVSP